VVVDEMPGESVLARGCGWDVSYVCRGRGSATITCATDVVHRSSDRLGQNTFTPAVTAPPATGPAEAGDQRREEIAAAPQPPAVPNLASERVRAWIDAQREAILACTERTSAVVIARWDASGVVTLTLSGDLAGSTQEGCMRAATGAQQDTTGTSGELRHLVR